MEKIIHDFILAHDTLSPITKNYYKNTLLNLSKKAKFKRKNLIDYFNSDDFKTLKIGSQNLYKFILKKFLSWSDPKMNVDFIQIKRNNTHTELNKDDLLTKIEIKSVLDTMTRSMDKCLFMLFLELGVRIRELSHIKLQDINDKGTHYIITIQVSKTKQRPIPVIDTIPYLIEWINQHPDPDNPEAYLFTHKYWGKLVKYYEDGLRKIIQRGTAHLDKKIWPHLLRHTAASRDIKHFTEKEMMLKYGWSTRRSIDRYAHLVHEDLEGKVLELHGIRKPQPEQDIQIIEPKKCGVCGHINPASNRFCSRCGRALTLEGVEIEKDLALAEQFSEAQKQEILDILMKLLADKNNKKN